MVSTQRRIYHTKQIELNFVENIQTYRKIPMGVEISLGLQRYISV